MAQPLMVHLPAPRVLIRQAGRHLLEATLVPLVLFYAVLTTVGMNGALIAALGWSFAALGIRLALRKPVPAVLLLTTLLLVARTVVGFLTGSIFLYFLQPTLQNFLIAFVLLATAAFERPFIAKLADDFCAFPTSFSGHPHVQRFFRRVSLLWALVFTTNGAATLWILARETLGNFLVVSTAGSWTVVALAALGSLWWFRRALRDHNIHLRLGPPKAISAAGA
jgi:intracellular septation protein A